LQLTQNEKDALVAFMRTLSGIDVYTNRKWSNPFL
jgi:cytochrome c peroxidase